MMKRESFSIASIYVPAKRRSTLDQKTVSDKKALVPLLLIERLRPMFGEERTADDGHDGRSMG